MSAKVLAFEFRSSGNLLAAYSEDLAKKELLHRPVNGANCAAWIIGHLVHTDRRAATLMGVADLPPLPEGFEKRFSREGDAPKADEYGDVTMLVKLFRESREKIAAAIEKLPEEVLNKPLEKPSSRYSTLGEMIGFMALHTAMHSGQITIIRRSLGRPPLI